METVLNIENRLCNSTPSRCRRHKNEFLAVLMRSNYIISASTENDFRVSGAENVHFRKQFASLTADTSLFCLL